MKKLLFTLSLILCASICEARIIQRTFCANGLCGIQRKVDVKVEIKKDGTKVETKKVEIKRPNVKIERKVEVIIEAPKPL